MEKGKYNIQSVADYFLCLVDVESGSAITPLKLQKLVYYAQAWYLAMNEKPLFDDEFTAWQHGPANRELYNKYRSCGYNPIPAPSNRNFDFSNDDINFLNSIWDTYGKYDGKYLEHLTHIEKPWEEASKKVTDWITDNVVISKQSMLDYYKLKLNETV
jgi:uncharacterized phage-associated protein